MAEWWGCRGGYVLGNCCGECPRCAEEREELFKTGRITEPTDEAAKAWGAKERGDHRTVKPGDRVTRHSIHLRSDGEGAVHAKFIQNPQGSAVMFTDYVALEAKYMALEEKYAAEERKWIAATAELQGTIDKIEAQRAKWRAAKSKSRHKEQNPLRYNPGQTSIYGEEHVRELTS